MRIKIEPDIKICTICKEGKCKTNFALEPGKSNPNRRRNQCDTCRNKYTRKRNFKNNTHKKRYWSMTEEERQHYIKYKSELNQVRLKTNPKALAKKRAYDKTDRAIFLRYKSEGTRGSRLKRGIKFELTFEQLSDMINSNCTYCNKENCRGVDRVNTNESYTIENSTSCCWVCNTMKSDLSIEDFKAHISNIYKNLNPT